MQFDETSIAVRERGMLEILDLSLHVIRKYFRPLLIMWLLGVVPMMVLNHIMIGGLLNRIEFDGSLYFGDGGIQIRNFNYLMTLLVTIEAPLATVFMSQFLGNAVFQHQPKLISQVTGVLRSVWPLFVAQVLVRGLGLFWALILLFPPGGPGASGAMLFFLLVFHAAVRATRPYINEIILLEKNPLSKGNSNELTVGRRSQRLHAAGGSGSGLVFGRSLVAFLFSVVLIYAVYGAFMFISGVMWNDWDQGAWLIKIGYPLAMWIVVGFLAVARFLCYLDTRIRFEGWEVELRLRAEAERLTGKIRTSPLHH